jgi:hypothetical protein
MNMYIIYLDRNWSTVTLASGNSIFKMQMYNSFSLALQYHVTESGIVPE